MTQKHTPLPWHVFHDDSGGPFTGWPSIGAAEELDKTIIHRAGFKQEFWGDCSEKEADANAAFIVRACNSHYELLEALKLLTDGYGHTSYLSNAEKENDEDVIQARAAIAKAEGK